MGEGGFHAQGWGDPVGESWKGAVPEQKPGRRQRNWNPQPLSKHSWIETNAASETDKTVLTSLTAKAGLTTGNTVQR